MTGIETAAAIGATVTVAVSSILAPYAAIKSLVLYLHIESEWPGFNCKMRSLIKRERKNDDGKVQTRDRV